jgi:hypothetical protein
VVAAGTSLVRRELELGNDEPAAPSLSKLFFGGLIVNSRNLRCFKNVTRRAGHNSEVNFKNIIYVFLL